MTLAYKLAFFTVSALFITAPVGADDPGLAVQSSECGSERFDEGASYGDSMSRVLGDLLFDTADRGYDYYAETTRDGRTCYGHAACSGDVLKDQCYRCIQFAASYLMARCTRCYGAQVQLPDCRVRYETYPFTE